MPNLDVNELKRVLSEFDIRYALLRTRQDEELELFPLIDVIE